jgi:hypothetical protein
MRAPVKMLVLRMAEQPRAVRFYTCTMSLPLLSFRLPNLQRPSAATATVVRFLKQKLSAARYPRHEERPVLSSCRSLRDGKSNDMPLLWAAPVASAHVRVSAQSMGFSSGATQMSLCSTTKPAIRPVRPFTWQSRRIAPPWVMTLVPRRRFYGRRDSFSRMSTAHRPNLNLNTTHG